MNPITKTKMLKNIYAQAVLVLNKDSLKKLLVYFILAVSVLFVANTLLPAPEAFAQDGTYDGTRDKPGLFGAGNSAREQARLFINFFLGFLGFLATAMIIYGGFLYVTAAGNQEKTDQGKKIIMYSVVGILIILVSFAIVNTVLAGAPLGEDVATQ